MFLLYYLLYSNFFGTSYNQSSHPYHFDSDLDPDFHFDADPHLT
jgi:hypothetical protein